MNEAQLDQAMRRAASTILADHGWPWEVNTDGLLASREHKAEAMLMLAFVMGHQSGYQEHIDLVSPLLARLIERLAP
jgi:hypothetical protein